MTATTELPIDTLPGKLLSLDSPSTLKTKPCSQQAPPTLMPLTHLDSVIAPNLSAEAKKKAEGYGPGCSPVLLQMVASVKRMQPYSTKFPTSKLAKIIETSPATPKLVDVTLQKL
ncbi:hypothetical protein Pst134EA_000508 [Puccinia striiformis f. sp. tritici]|uniref:hypothetical protein n=1 Tax=Puccinia striiformis f. sp. tritici TaxID=168172 RepID=UPI0020078097|nr:hypothetical protein Pst134EA_000508 [Puccinia striiformis f. sp. tritici]KAH9473437.1 hypothetical protein Pst134EA_000508 [Puccinia striiformis f. sp. tritici]